MAAGEQRAQRLCVPTHAWAPCLSSWANGPPGPSLPGPRLCSQPGRRPRRSTQGLTRLAVRPAGPELGRAVWALLSLSCTEWNFTRCRRVRAESVPPSLPSLPGGHGPPPPSWHTAGPPQARGRRNARPTGHGDAHGIAAEDAGGAGAGPSGAEDQPPGGEPRGAVGHGPSHRPCRPVGTGKAQGLAGHSSLSCLHEATKVPADLETSA